MITANVKQLIIQLTHTAQTTTAFIFQNVFIWSKKETFRLKHEISRLIFDPLKKFIADTKWDWENHRARCRRQRGRHLMTTNPRYKKKKQNKNKKIENVFTTATKSSPKFINASSRNLLLSRHQLGQECLRTVHNQIYLYWTHGTPWNNMYI